MKWIYFSNYCAFLKIFVCCHEVDIHQPHRPHPLATGVLPPVVRQYCRTTFLKQTLIMEATNLTYNKTFTVEQFKTMQQDSRIEVITNPKTGKLFFVCGNTQGAVSSNVSQTNTPVVSEVTDPTTGSTFFMLHARSNKNVVMTF